MLFVLIMLIMLGLNPSINPSNVTVISTRAYRSSVLLLKLFLLLQDVVSGCVVGAGVAGRRRREAGQRPEPDLQERGERWQPLLCQG